MIKITCTAPVNIAVIKYWGKREEKEILPINSSVSVSLDQAQLRAKTSVALSQDFEEDLFWLNGEKQPTCGQRLQAVLSEIRRKCRKRKVNEITNDHFINWKVHICSENNFPTAAGLASSAAGFACLVYALSKAFQVEGEISNIARQGSGSACRSIYGGFVEWEMGVMSSGCDSIAKQIAPETHWSNLRILILVVSVDKKAVGSTAGMQTSVLTSDLLKYRAENIVPSRIQQIKEAIKEKNFPTFAKLTMKDSNQMHACCLDTYPPISYMNDTSREIQRLVHYINDKAGSDIVAYTFDAGPNACLFLLEENVEAVLGVFKHCYMPKLSKSTFIRGIKLPVNDTLNNDMMKDIPFTHKPSAVQYIIHTKAGPGPQLLDDQQESLLDSNGFPISH